MLVVDQEEFMGQTSVDRDMLHMPVVLEKCNVWGCLVFDNLVAGPDQTDLVYVLDSD